jgi:hypothetical protein
MLADHAEMAGILLQPAPGLHYDERVSAKGELLENLFEIDTGRFPGRGGEKEGYLMKPKSSRIQTLGIWLVLVLCHPVLRAAEDGSGKPADVPEQPPSLSQLPAPLDGITGNILDLEKSGHFKILKARIGRTRQFESEALIWTITALRPLTSAHAQILLRRVGDVRFYRIEDDAQWREQVMINRLYYPMWIDFGIANRETLNQDEQFEIWVPLTAAQVDRLVQEQTNKVIFSHVNWPTKLPEATKKSSFPMPLDRY